MQISNAQSRAIAHGAGPAMVLAGPGSGKTLVITQRTKYLIEQYHINPREILVITFTKAAADEMRQRFLGISDSAGVTFGTFHAVFFGILKQAYRFDSANILSEEKKYQILLQLMRQARINPGDEKETLGELSAEISLVKNEQIDLAHYYSRCCPEEAFRVLYERYEQIRREMRMLDFDDMLVYTYDLLKNRQDILEGWQKRFRFILVDEFQDINLLQYNIVRLLAGQEKNLFIVGDDDQSIYRFRGAKPEIMQRFPEDFPGCKTVLLDQNFRSVSPIITGALQVIEGNTNRFKKEIHAVRQRGEEIDIQEFENQEHESLYLIKCILQRVKMGVPLSEIAVLFRTNQGAGPFAQRLLEFNIPFEMREILPNVYEHWIAKDIFAYLHLARQELSRTQFFQVMNRPKRYISRDSIDSSVISFETLRTYYEEKEWMLDRLDRMEYDLKLLAGMTPYAAINYIRYGIQYDEFLKEYAELRKMKPQELTDLLDEIQQCAKPFQTYEEWFAHLEQYRKALEEKKKSRNRKREDAVALATFHSSKGLEFSEVFLVDVNEGVIPHRKASVEADIEEERRLLYVGMTRAKDRLHLFYTKERYGKIADPSTFITGLISTFRLLSQS